MHISAWGFESLSADGARDDCRACTPWAPLGGFRASGYGPVWSGRLVWDQEIAGSNPATRTGTDGFDSALTPHAALRWTWVRLPAFPPGRAVHNLCVWSLSATAYVFSLAAKPDISRWFSWHDARLWSVRLWFESMAGSKRKGAPAHERIHDCLARVAGRLWCH